MCTHRDTLAGEKNTFTEIKMAEPFVKLTQGRTQNSKDKLILVQDLSAELAWVRCQVPKDETILTGIYLTEAGGQVQK